MKVFSLLFLLFVQNLFSHPCVFKDKIDLRRLALPEGYYVHGFEKFDFLLNICASIKDPRLIPCNRDVSIPSVIYSFMNNKTLCHAVSRSFTHIDDVNVSWINEMNHEKGVELVYKNGRSFDHDGEILSTITRIEIGCNKLQ